MSDEHPSIPDREVARLLECARTASPDPSFVRALGERIASERTTIAASPRPAWRFLGMAGAAAAIGAIVIAIGSFGGPGPEAPPARAAEAPQVLLVRIEARSADGPEPLPAPLCQVLSGAELVVAVEVGPLDEGGLVRLSVEEVLAGSLPASGPCGVPPTPRFATGARGILVFRGGRVPDADHAVLFPAGEWDRYHRLVARVRGYLDGTAVGPVLARLGGTGADPMLDGETWLWREGSLARDVREHPAFRSEAGVGTAIEYLEAHPETPATAPALELLAAARSYRAERWLAGLAVQGSALAARALLAAARRDAGFETPPGLDLREPRRVTGYVTLIPVGIGARLSFTAWAVGGEVVRVERGSGGEPRARLEPLTILRKPEGVQTLPEAWGESHPTGCNPDVVEYREGTWILVLTGPEGGLPSAVVHDALVAVTGDPGDFWALGARLRAIERRDPAVAHDLVADLRAGGGRLPWSAPADLIADLLLVGGVAEGEALLEWADSSSDPELADAARRVGRRLTVAGDVRAELDRVVDESIRAFGEEDWSVRERASERLVEWLADLSRPERAHVERRASAIDPAEVEIAERFARALDAVR